ncbi:MAG: hypothetical protein WCP72_11000 [Desulfomonile sp.]
MPVQIATKSITDQIVRETNVHFNLGQDAIIITEDKVRLILMTHLRNLEQKKGWIVPASLLVTIGITFATTDFRSVFGLEASTWKGIFLSVGCALCLLTGYTIYKSFIAPSLDNIVSEMKREAKSMGREDTELRVDSRGGK